MPSKRASKSIKKKTSVRKNHRKQNENDDGQEEFQNSEDEYSPKSEDEHSSQSGGVTDDENELGSDSANLDIDPDDEKDPNEDEKYDPVEENEELEDPDEETDIEDEVVEEGAEAAVEEEAEEGEGEGETVEGEEGYTGEAKQCHLKNLNKDFIVLDEDDSNMYGKMEYKRIAEADRETDAIMTYYEMVRIIGTRTQQFNFGAEPLVKGLEGIHPAKMAYIELISKMTPFIIRRHLPGKKYEEWRVDELEIIHAITDDFFVPEKFDWDALMKQVNELNTRSEILPEKTTSKSQATSSRVSASKPKPKKTTSKSKKPTLKSRKTTSKSKKSTTKSRKTNSKS